MDKRMAVAAVATMIVAGAALAGPERLEFPKDYRSTFTYVTTRDMHRGGNTIVDIYANPAAVKGRKEAVLPNGSVVLMEAWSAKLDDKQQPVVDTKGRMVKNELRGFVIMEKQAGWGSAYPAETRNGDWDYASFGLDGARRSGSTADCFECHGQLKDLDYVYTKPDLEDLPQ